jgi:hypothetical protein
MTCRRRGRRRVVWSRRLCGEQPCHHPMLSLGPLLVPALIGAWPPWRLPRQCLAGCRRTVLGLLVFLSRAPVGRSLLHRFSRRAIDAAECFRDSPLCFSRVCGRRKRAGGRLAGATRWC